MISLGEWDITHFNEVETSSKKNHYEDIYLGKELALDERSKWIDNYSKKVGKNIHITEFDESQAVIVLDNTNRYSVNDLNKIPTNKGNILFDATSLLLPELLYLMVWANQTSQNFDVIYVEPSDYSAQKYKSDIGSHNPDFSLSEDGPGLKMMPKFVFPLMGSHLVASLGYEGHRFGSLLSSDEISPDKFTGVLGVPPFVLGWEKNSYSKNYRVMSEARKNFGADFKATSANDPLQNYQLLNLLLAAQGATQRRSRKLHLVPIGTKPAAIGMIWFAINNDGIGILYDFIIKKPKRTKGVGKVHMWSFQVK